MNSFLYTGTVRHRRFAPTAHAFTYPLFMTYLDLDELPGLFDGRWLWSARRPAPAWFRRADYLGTPAIPLAEAVRDEAERLTGARPDGPIRMLGHLRYLGYVMNPVTFYYCFAGDGETVDTIVAEITNTPWGERHTYALGAGTETSAGGRRRRFQKAFHVSPFMPMDQRYDWRFTAPGRRLAVHMESLEGGRKIFDATLSLHRRPITRATLAGALARFPWMTGRVIGGIYWQAALLRLKGAPLHSHPERHSA